jgi:hypothetical protein
MSIPLVLAGIKSAMAAVGGLGATLQAGLAVGSTALSYMGASAQAKSENAAIETANNTARQQAISDYDQITLRGQQEKASASSKMFDTQIDRKKAVASASASASEAGVGGLSVDALLTDIYGNEARIRDGVNQNLESTKSELDNMSTTTARNLTNTIQSRAPVSKPSLTGALLEAGTGIYGAYKDNLRTTAKVNRK